MGKSKESDLRYVKTEELIHGVFKQMLLKKEYSRITVKELTERARINRKTFYAHHVTLNELLLNTGMRSEEMQAIHIGLSSCTGRSSVESWV